MGAASSYGIVGGAGVHANGAGSAVAGDVGIDPAAATFITGFPANAVIDPPFSNHGNDAFAIAAAAAVQILYDSAQMAPAGGTPTVANLSIGGPTNNGIYTPGKYFVNVGTALIPTAITLSTPGQYIFTVNSDLTAAVGSNILLGAGVDPCNVWWRVPTQATLNGATFVGNVVSNAAVVLGSGARLTGRALTTDAGAVTLAGTNSIGGCSAVVPADAPPPAGCPVIGITPTVLPNGEVGVAYNQQILGNSGTAPYVYTTNASFLPAGLTLSATGSLSGTPTSAAPQTFTVRATDALLCFAERQYTMVFGNAIPVPTLPQGVVIVLALGLMALGYYRLRRQSHPFGG